MYRLQCIKPGELISKLVSAPQKQLEAMCRQCLTCIEEVCDVIVIIVIISVA